MVTPHSSRFGRAGLAGLVLIVMGILVFEVLQLFDDGPSGAIKATPEHALGLAAEARLGDQPIGLSAERVSVQSVDARTETDGADDAKNIAPKVANTVPHIDVLLVDSNDRPIRGVEIRTWLEVPRSLSSAKHPRSARTGPDGRVRLPLDHWYHDDGTLRPGLEKLERLGKVGIQAQFPEFEYIAPWTPPRNPFVWLERIEPYPPEVVLVGPECGSASIRFEWPRTPDGSPLHAVMAEAWSYPRWGREQRYTSWLWLDQGEFVLGGLPLDEMLLVTIKSNNLLLGSLRVQGPQTPGEHLDLVVPMTVDASEAQVLEGRVVVPDGDTFVYVSAVLSGAGSEASGYGWTVEDGEASSFGRAKDDGRFQFLLERGRLQPGDSVRIRYSPFREQYERVVVVGPDATPERVELGVLDFEVPVEVPLPEEPKALLLRGRCVDLQGLPFAGATVHASGFPPEDHPHRSSRSAYAKTDELGNFEILGPSLLIGQDLSLLVSHAQVGNDRIPNAIGGGDPVELRLERLGALQFELLVDRMFEPKDFRVVLTPLEPDSGRVFESRVSGFHGRFRAGFAQCARVRSRVTVSLRGANTVLAEFETDFEQQLAPREIDLRGRFVVCAVVLWNEDHVAQKAYMNSPHSPNVQDIEAFGGVLRVVKLNDGEDAFITAIMQPSGSKQKIPLSASRFVPLSGLQSLAYSTFIVLE